MPGADFDIYQTESGYTAVTNEVRRQILQALAKKERQLPELVKLTKKAKPTLSSVHMRELLEAKLVEELPHPTDKRKKIYRLKARRIGSSNLPVDQLRDAVKQYVAGAPHATRVPVSLALEAIATAPGRVPDDALRAQARRLGELVASALPLGSGRDLVTSLATTLEREGLARPLKLDLEGLALDLELAADLASDQDTRGPLALAGLVEGLLGERSAGRVKVGAVDGRRFSLHLPER